MNKTTCSLLIEVKMQSFMTKSLLWLSGCTDHLKEKAQFVQNMTFRLWEKAIAQLQKMFRTIAMNTNATISVMLVCQFVYAETLFDFEGWVEKTLYRKTVVMDFLCAYNFIKKGLQHMGFPVNIAKPSRTTTLQNICKHCPFDSVNTFDMIRFYHILVA